MSFRAFACLALLLASPAAAQTYSDPLSRGVLTFQTHASGLQYPRYEAAPAQTCAPAPASGLRQRLVDLAVQEWARFGYPIARRAGDVSAVVPELAARDLAITPYDENDPLLLQAIGGYWAALTGVDSSGVSDVGGYEINERNTVWEETAGELRRNDGWRTPWSAAFISWLMCDAGAAPFARSWAHRDYVDAAIAAAEGGPAQLYHARAPDRVPAIGDLLCASRADYRPANLAARRAEAGAEGEMHCDLVVAIDAPHGAVLAIGGNVENGVTLTRYGFRRGWFGGVRLQSLCAPGEPCAKREERLFALLVLQAPPQADAALARAPALAAPPARPPPLFPSH